MEINDDLHQDENKKFNSTTKKHFISFADKKYSKTLMRIKNQSIESGFFDVVETFNEEFLSEEIKKYCLSNGRGYGFWIWKPILIKNYLDNMNYGDILTYCDAGCTINKEGRQRFEEYINILSNPENDIITFNMEHLEKYWSKRDIFVHFNADNLMDTGQVCATSIILKKTEKTINLINEWYNVCINNRNLIDDSRSINGESSFFIDNRHDQSLFSMVSKKYKTFELTNETYVIVDGNHNVFNKQYPIQATRLRF
jgi:hypothetical protein